MVNADGTILNNKTLDMIAFNGNNSFIGYAVVIHNMTDDCNSTSSSAARLAWGVIGVANPGLYGNFTQNDAYPTNVAPVTKAVCVLRSATAQTSGTPVTGVIYFSQPTPASSTEISAVITGLDNNGMKPRGFHVHQWGDLSQSNGNSAGPHYTGPVYNATAPHGIPGNGGNWHVGDMGNLFVYAPNGTAVYYNSLSQFGLYGSLNSIIGRAVVVHNLTDDCTGTNGNAGARLAFCVIGAANPAWGGNLTQLSSVASTQNVSFCPGNGMTSGMHATSSMMTTGVAQESSNAAFVAMSVLLIALAALLA